MLVSNPVPDSEIPAVFRSDTVHRGVLHARALAAAGQGDTEAVIDYVLYDRGPVSVALRDAMRRAGMPEVEIVYDLPQADTLYVDIGEDPNINLPSEPLGDPAEVDDGDW